MQRRTFTSLRVGFFLKAPIESSYLNAPAKPDCSAGRCFGLPRLHRAERPYAFARRIYRSPRWLARAGLLCGEVELFSGSTEQHDQQDDEKHKSTAAGVVSPTGAIGPSRQRTYQKDEQDDKK